MDTSDLTSGMQEMMAEMAAMRAELADLKQRANVISPPQPIQPAVSTTRRKALRRLAGGLLAGLTVGSVAASMPQAAQAKFVAAGIAGAIVVPPGGTVSGNLTGNSYGLIATPDTSLSTNSISFVSKAGLAGITTASAPFTYGIYGSGGAVGIYGTASAGVIGSAGVMGTGNYGVTGIGNLNGVRGDSTNDSNSIGVYGNSTSGTGIMGNSTNGVGVIGTTIANDAIKGISANGTGVYGQSTYDTGVSGYSTNFFGVYGNGKEYGVFGESGSTGTAGLSNAFTSKSIPANTSVGVFADAGYNLDLSLFGDNQNIGLYVIAGTNGGRTATAGVFNGAVFIYGNLSKSGGSFKIDHPLDPANKYLYHSFVESPDMMNIYNGIVTLDDQGEAVVEMPNWFEALNSDFRYQLTCMDRFSSVYIAERIKDRKFKIAGGQPGQEISWQVTGIRQDAWAKSNRIPVEEAKTGANKGKYLHPEVLGKSEEFRCI